MLLKLTAGTLGVTADALRSALTFLAPCRRRDEPAGSFVIFSGSDGRFPVFSVMTISRAFKLSYLR